jgi:hypothetical protein
MVSSQRSTKRTAALGARNTAAFYDDDSETAEKQF